MKYVLIALLVAVVLLTGESGLAAAGQHSPPPTVRSPWHVGMPQKGIAIYWRTDRRSTVRRSRNAADKVFDYAISIGANSVSITFPFFVNGISGTKVYGNVATPSPAMVKAALAEANKRHLRMTLRPLMDEKNLVAMGGWRGSIRPYNRKRWFASYRRFLAPYLIAAQTEHIATFAIGTELNSLANDSLWRPFVRWAKQRYHGKLLYAANWDAVTTLVGGLAGNIGIDTYFKTSLPDNASVAQIAHTWDVWLKANVPSRRNVVLSEVGIAAEPGAYRAPWRWGSSNRHLDLAVQQRWFKASCIAYRQRKLGGIYYWRVSFGQKLKPANWRSKDHGTFAGRPAAGAIKSCFAR